MTDTIHTRIDGPLVMIGFGSIGRGTLPLITRHIAFDRDQFTVIEPSADFAGLLAEHGIRHLQVVYSPEPAAETRQLEAPSPGRRSVPASVPWVPSTAGILMASAIVRNLIANESE